MKKTNIAIIISILTVLFLAGFFFLRKEEVVEDIVEEEEVLVTEIGLELVAEGFTSPLGLIPSNDGTGRKFVIDQAGLIRIIDREGNLLEGGFLDLRDHMVELRTGFDERGLLGLAFHPDFGENGRFFVHYSAPLREGGPAEWDHTSTIAEIRVDDNDPNVADIDSKRIIIEVDQPQFNHNGGHLAFGPDGYLYIALGDGGGANDVGLGHPDIGNGQDTSTLLGSILRIDVDGAEPYSVPRDNPFVGEEGLDEIFAYGLRNPYHISFDRGGANDLFVADVGQDLWEEVNIVTRGGNYGWNIREGMNCFDPERPADPPAECPMVGVSGELLIDPILEYRNARNEGIGIAIVGGYLYRGNSIPGLTGSYLFADWSRGFGEGDGSVFAAERENGEWVWREFFVSNERGDGRLGLFITGVGEDHDGELYLLTTENAGPSGETGKVYRIVSAR